MFKEQIINNTILVIGDFILDTYWIGDVSRISPEAPVPVFQKKSEKAVVGGAANVVANLIAAGKKVTAVSVIGEDAIGDKLLDCLVTLGCNCDYIVRSRERKTTEKTRLLAQNNQQLIRIDEEVIMPLTEEEERNLIQRVKEQISGIKAIILSDYMKGVLTEALCKKIIALAKENNVCVYCDVKDVNTEKYKGAELIKPNQKELEMLTGMPTNSEDSIRKACKTLADKCENTYVLVTLGAQGMALYTKETDEITFFPSEKKEVYDVSGAGDTVISYLVACLSSEMEMHQSVNYANKAAGIKVGKVGTAVVTLDEMDKADAVSQRKVYTWEQLLEVPHLKEKKVVFTNGCFDILHAGHVMYLQKAACYGDVLIVGVNGDDSIKRLKGPGRPINSLSDRLTVLSSLACITYIVVFDEDTPEELIQNISPDVLVKGADYEGKFIAGADYVKRNGGEVVLIPLLENRSTTEIVNRMEQK